MISYVQRCECTGGTAYMCSILVLIAVSDAEDKQLSNTSLCLIRPEDKQHQYFIFYKKKITQKTPLHLLLIRKESYTVRNDCRNNVHELCQDKWEWRWEEEEPQLIASLRFNQQRLWVLILSWSWYE